MQIYSTSQNRTLGPVRKVDSFSRKLLGALIQNPALDSTPLWMPRCNAVHMLGMRHSLDLVFLDRNLKVVKKVLSVRPWTLAVFCLKAHSVIEFFTGYWDPSQIAVGDRLEIR